MPVCEVVLGCDHIYVLCLHVLGCLALQSTKHLVFHLALEKV